MPRRRRGPSLRRLRRSPITFLIVAIIAIVAYTLRDEVAPDHRTFKGEHFNAPAELREDYVPVLRVVDGDTLKIRYQGNDESLRLIGVNSPEIAHPPKTTTSEPGGIEASEWLQDFLRDDPQVRLEFDEDRRDKYDRLLAYAWALRKGEEVMINEELVKRGHAKPKYYAPNGKYRKRLENAALAPTP